MPRKRLTPLQESELRRKEAERAKAEKKDKKPIERSDEEKALRKERVALAKDAIARSAGTKGDHVPPARLALKNFLRNLNEPNQPDDERFKILIEAPFKAPPKKKNDRY